jgi:hypothetical protein
MYSGDVNLQVLITLQPELTSRIGTIDGSSRHYKVRVLPVNMGSECASCMERVQFIRES